MQLGKEIDEDGLHLCALRSSFCALHPPRKGVRGVSNRSCFADPSPGPWDEKQIASLQLRKVSVPLCTCALRCSFDLFPFSNPHSHLHHLQPAHRRLCVAILTAS